jgi:hypothetical protein
MATIQPISRDCCECLALTTMGLTDEGTETRLFHPQRDRWLAHFDWSVNGTVIVGLTEIGVVTVNLLRMNRPQLVEVRSLWVIIGKHPPN